MADEISLGLAPTVLDEVYIAIGELSAVGTAVVLIEQQTSRAIEAADVAVVLAHGRVAFNGPPDEAASVLAAGISTTGYGSSL